MDLAKWLRDRKKSAGNVISRTVDQVNPFDNNRTWQQRTPTNTKSVSQQYQETKKRSDTALDLGIQRSLVGTGQAATGLFDLLTPGKGTNRYSKGLDEVAKSIDDEVKTRGVSSPLYKTGQLVFDVGTSYGAGALGKAGVKVGVKAAPTAVKNVAQSAAGATNKALGTAQNAVIRNTAPTIAKGGVRGTANKIATDTVTSMLTPQALRATAAGTAFNLGQDASKGYDVSPASVAANVGFGALTAGALPAVTSTTRAIPLRDTIRQAKTNTSKAVTAVQQAGTKVDEKLFGVGDARVGLQDQAILKDYSDYLVGANKAQGAELSDLIAQARQIGNKYGVDLTNAPIETKVDSIGAILDTIGKNRTSQMQGGFVRIPGGKNDIAPELSAPQKEFINDYAEMLEGIDSTLTGGVKQRTEDGFMRTTEHTPFYSNYFAENGKAPSKQAWFDEARRQIESGRAEFGASDDFKAIPKSTVAPQSKQPTPEQSPQVGKTETPVAKSERLHQEKLAKNNLTQNEYAGLHQNVADLDNRASELHRRVGDATQKAIEESNGQPFTPKVQKELRAMADEWGKAQDDHLNALNKVRKIDGEKLIETSRSTPVAQVGKTPETPKTVKVFVKSKFRDGGGYADVPVIRKEENITLYQGANAGDNRQFWTPNKKYASQFGEVKEKTGTFYQVDNGNRMTDVYVDANPTPAPQVGKTPTPAQSPQALPPSQPKTTQPVVNKEVSSSDSIARSQFAQRAGTSQEISPELQTKIKQTKPQYTKVTNEQQVAQSDKLVGRGYKKAATDVSARLDAKNSGTDAQTVSDAIATIKKLDEKGNPTNYQIADELVEKLSLRLTEAGQTVQAATLLSNRTPQGLYFSAKRQLKKNGVTVTPKMEAEFQRLLTDVKATKAGSPEGDLARFRFIEYTNKFTPSDPASKLVQIWKAGLLTGPITPAGNTAANVFEQTTKRLYEDPIATGVDMLMSVFTGKRSKSLTSRGLLSGTKEGGVKGVSYFKTGYDPRDPAKKFDVREIHYSDKPLGKLAEKYTQAVFKLMGAQDQPFYYASLRNSLYDQAITAFKNSGLPLRQRSDFIKKFITEPDKKTMQLADTEARYDVFQNKTLLGEAASGIKNKTGAVGDFLIPFSQVPSSIATRIVERTPIGTATEIVRQFKSGKFDQRRMSQAIARGTTGVVLVGVGKALAENDMITLGFPSDEKERRLWQLEGKQPFSIKIGGAWRSLNYFQPAGTIMAAGAEYANAKAEGESGTAAWSRALAATGKAFTEQSFIRGIGGVIDAVTDPQRSASKFLESTAGSIIPNFIRSPARAFDDKQRQVNSVGDAIKGAIPGLRQSLDAKVDAFGNDVPRQSSAGNALINPTRPSDVKELDATGSELRRLQDAELGVMTPDITKTAFGSDTKIDEKQITELQKIVYPEIKSAWDAVIADPRYAELSDEDKQDALAKISKDIYTVKKQEYAQANSLGQFSPEYEGDVTKLTKDQRRIANGGAPKLDLGSDENETYADRYQAALDEWNDKDNGYTAIDKISKQKELQKLTVRKDYSEDANQLYELSEGDVYNYVSQAPNGQKLADELIALDQAMYDKGLIKNRKYKGGISPPKTAGSGGSGGSKSAAGAMSDYDIKVGTEKRLRQLLGSTGTTTASAPKRVNAKKVALKKITV